MKRVRFKDTVTVYTIPKCDGCHKPCTQSLFKKMRFKYYVEQVEPVLKPVLLKKIGSYENELAEETTVDHANIASAKRGKEKVQCV